MGTLGTLGTSIKITLQTFIPVREARRVRFGHQLQHTNLDYDIKYYAFFFGLGFMARLVAFSDIVFKWSKATLIVTVLASAYVFASFAKCANLKVINQRLKHDGINKWLWYRKNLPSLLAWQSRGR